MQKSIICGKILVRDTLQGFCWAYWDGDGAMCEIIEKYKAEGFAQGLTEGFLQAAVSLWQKGKLTEQEAADEAGISLEEFKKVAASGGTI